MVWGLIRHTRLLCSGLNTPPLGTFPVHPSLLMSHTSYAYSYARYVCCGIYGGCYSVLSSVPPAINTVPPRTACASIAKLNAH
jgi:hypothetical protein